MPVCYVHLSVDASSGLDSSDIAAATQSDVVQSALQAPPGRLGLTVRRVSSLSRSAAAREETESVLAELRAAGIAVRHLATTLPDERARSLPEGSWVLLRTKLRSRRLRRLIRFPLPSSGWRRSLAVALRRLVVVVVGARAHITAGSYVEAAGLARQLVERPIGDRLLAIPAPRSPQDEDRRFGSWVIGMAAVVGVVLGLTATRSPVPWILGAASLALVVYASVSRPPAEGTRSDRVGAAVVAVVGACLLYLAFSRLSQGVAGRFVYLLTVLGGLLLSVGVLTEWRARRFGEHLAWALPIVLSVVGGVTLALGVLAYRLFEEELGIPAGALSYETIDYAIAGALPVLIGVCVFLIGVGLAGLNRRYLGGATAGHGQVVLFGLLGSVSAFSTAVGLVPPVAAEFRAPGNTETHFPFYGVRADSSCLVFPATSDRTIEGGAIDEGVAWLLLGEKDSRYLVWNPRDDYRRVPVDQVTIAISQDGEAECSPAGRP